MKPRFAQKVAKKRYLRKTAIFGTIL